MLSIEVNAALAKRNNENTLKQYYCLHLCEFQIESCGDPDEWNYIQLGYNRGLSELIIINSHEKQFESKIITGISSIIPIYSIWANNRSNNYTRWLDYSFPMERLIYTGWEKWRTRTAAYLTTLVEKHEDIIIKQGIADDI